MFGPIFPGFIPVTIIGYLAKAVIDWACYEEGGENPQRSIPVPSDFPIVFGSPHVVRSPDYNGNGWIIR